MEVQKCEDFYWKQCKIVFKERTFDATSRDQLYKIGLPGKFKSRRLFSREYDFLKTFSLTENQFSGKTYFYTIASRVCGSRVRVEISNGQSRGGGGGDRGGGGRGGRFGDRDRDRGGDRRRRSRSKSRSRSRDRDRSRDRRRREAIQ